MKLQNLIIIFIIIIIPIVLIFSLYLNLETKTIMLQTDYDEKLIEATKEAVEAFEINTTEWNSKYSSLANLKRQNLMSSINVFTTSLSDKLRIGGTSKENILSYIPAIVYIMYDGYYIYSPTYVPETITNENGVQLFYYEHSGSEGAKITASATQNIGGTIVDGEPMYVYKEGTVKTGTYNGETISFTTNIEDAKKTYKHVLKTFVPYTTTYIDNNGEECIVNYTLDNYIRVYGEIQSKEGYIIEDFGNTNKIEIPVNSDYTTTTIKYNGKEIEQETLTENIYVRDNVTEEAQLKTYPYIYNSSNDKRYYDSATDKFFTLSNNNVKVYLPDTYVGHTLAEYKKVLIRTSNTNWDYLELYQLLNGNDDTWYYKEGNDQYLRCDFCQPNISRESDCSAINYYVETASFNHWLDDNNIDTDAILEQKKQTIVENINNNLNLSISNYNANSKLDYVILELSDSDWDQALSNISMITFFQGKKIGLKTYNNYAIVTSTENNEYVSEDSLYYIGENDNYYHRYYCNKGTPDTNRAYKNTDFKVQSYNQDGSIKYYFKHDGTSGGEVYECFDCIVNRNNYNEETEAAKMTSYDITFYTALARERYIQMSKVNLIIDLNKTLTVTFDPNGGSCATANKQVTYNSTYGTLPTATKAGCGFAGWYTSKFGGNKITSATKVTETQNHSLYARWTSVVTFDPNGGSCDKSSQEVIQGNKYGTLPIPTRTGYNFAGWYTAPTGGNIVTAATTVPSTGDHTLYAHWDPAQYMVTFDANGGSCATANKQVTYNSTYGTLPTPTRTGHTFAGWYTEKTGGTLVTNATIVNRAENHTLYAHWNKVIYTITYDANGGSGAPSSQTKEYGTNLTLSSTIPTRTGYTFLGWSTNSSATNATYQPGGIYSANSSTTLYAVWNINTYTIKYDANGGSGAPSSQTKYYGTDLTLSSTTPTRTGYTFLGWSISSSATEATYSAGGTYTANSGATLYAVWRQNSFTITYNANGGSGAPASQTKEYGTNLTLSSTIPTRTGYTFLGWATSSTATSATYAAGGTYTANSGATLYAVWSLNTYTITYNANGGSGAPSSQTKYYGTNLTLSSKVPTRSGYTFLGWATSSTATTAAYQPGGTYTANSGATLYAVWQQVIAVTSVTLNQTSDQWIPYKNNGSAGTLSLTATVSPSNATNKTVTWTSSNTSVATVSNGAVTATGAGLTTITATAGGKSASVKVYVYNAVFGGGYTYTMRNSVGGGATGYFKANSGGAKMVISNQGNSYWYLSSYTNGYYESGYGQYFLAGSSSLSKYFTNYGAW